MIEIHHMEPQDMNLILDMDGTLRAENVIPELAEDENPSRGMTTNVQLWDRKYVRPPVFDLNEELWRTRMIARHQAEARMIRTGLYPTRDIVANQCSLSPQQLEEAKRLSDGITAHKKKFTVLTGEGNQGKALALTSGDQSHLMTKKKKQTKPKSENGGKEKCNLCGKLTPRKGSCFDCLNKAMFK